MASSDLHSREGKALLLLSVTLGVVELLVRAAAEPYLPPVCARSDTICWNRHVRSPFIFGRDTVQPRPPHHYDLSCTDSPNATEIMPFKGSLSNMYQGAEPGLAELAEFSNEYQRQLLHWVQDEEVMNDCLLLTVCARLLWLILVAQKSVERAATLLVVDGVGEEFWYAWINWIDVARSGWPLFAMLAQLSILLKGTPQKRQSDEESVPKRVARRLSSMDPLYPWSAYDTGDGWPNPSSEPQEMKDLRRGLLEALEGDDGRVPPGLSAGALLLADEQTHPFAIACVFLLLAASQVPSSTFVDKSGSGMSNGGMPAWSRGEVQDLVSRAAMHIKSYNGSTPFFALATSSWPVISAWNRLVRLGPAWWVPTPCPAVYQLAYRQRQRNSREFVDKLKVQPPSADDQSLKGKASASLNLRRASEHLVEVGNADVDREGIDTAAAHFLDQSVCFDRSCTLRAVLFLVKLASDDEQPAGDTSLSSGNESKLWEVAAAPTFVLYRLVDAETRRYVVLEEDPAPTIIQDGQPVRHGIAFARANGIQIEEGDCVGWYNLPEGWRIPFDRGGGAVLLQYGNLASPGEEVFFHAYVERRYSVRAILDCNPDVRENQYVSTDGIAPFSKVVSAFAVDAMPGMEAATDRQLLGLAMPSQSFSDVTDDSGEAHDRSDCEAWATVLWAEDAEKARGRREAEVWTDAVRTLAHSVRRWERASSRHRHCHWLDLGDGLVAWPSDPNVVRTSVKRRPFIVIIPREWPEDLDAPLLADGLVAWRVDWPLSHLPSWMLCNHQKTMKKTAAVRLRLWELEKYQRVVHLDIDMVVTGPLEHLFEMPVFAAPRMEVKRYAATSSDATTYVPPLVNLGLMVLQPNRSFLADVVAEMKRKENASIAAHPLISERQDDRACFQSTLDVFMRIRGSERLGEAVFVQKSGASGYKFLGCQVPEAPPELLRMPDPTRHHCVLPPHYNFMATDPHLDWQLEFVNVRRQQLLGLGSASAATDVAPLQVGPIRVLHWPGQPKPWGVRFEQRTVFDHEWWARHREMCAEREGSKHPCLVHC